MIVHAYFTDGFYPWAEIFLKSFKLHHGSDMPIVFSTRDITTDQTNNLYNIYDNLQIKNSSLSIEDMCKISGLSKDKLLKFKKQVETVHVTNKNKIWKLMIAADDRVKSTFDVLKEYQHEDYMLHFDIDMYFKSQITNLIEFVKEHDISIRLRLASKPSRKTMIGVQGYKTGPIPLEFFKRWIKYIDDVAPKNRPLGYGQTSCYYAYEEIKDKCKWGSIPRKFISPKMSESDVVWSANTKDGKTKNLEKCQKDFNKQNT